jgi:hypothetical protein
VQVEAEQYARDPVTPPATEGDGVVSVSRCSRGWPWGLAHQDRSARIAVEGRCAD